MPNGIELTQVAPMITNVGCNYRDYGFAKLSVALRYSLTDTDFCIDEPRPAGMLVVVRRSRARRPHPDIDEETLRGPLGVGLALQSAPAFQLVPTGATGLGARLLLEQSSQWTYSTLSTPPAHDGIRPETWKPVVKNLVSAGVLIREDGEGPSTRYMLADEVTTAEEAVERVRSAMRDRLEASSWGLSPDAIEAALEL